MRKTALPKSRKTTRKSLPHFHPVVSIITLVLGILGTVLVTHVLAQTTNNTIYACTQNATGIMRYVTDSTSCRPNESLLSWSKGGNISWGNITGILSNQTDLQNALNAKQDKLITYSDTHHKNLINNTDNNLFTFPLANGEATGFTMHYSSSAKKNSDWSIQSGVWTIVVYNDNGTLRTGYAEPNYPSDAGGGTLLLAGTKSTGSSVDLDNSGLALHASLNAGIVTIKYNPGNVGVSLDSIGLDYVVIDPSGKPLTFLP